ncbi:hypothetical protein DAPPUDRAFT_258491 [Daphnia pulex]|uniref:Uncharacterized protein n=1 Tax=Daphnia pulex TaxID=6669 RepID=E9HFH3_DAPPU|nr:hypothetical protein DAPPUDRAFT_258491 [Daphnia pulex]|eukprot:EFX69530.1 hypothetical protein DAPPUDRAFT_258491 [Daphnia pulex]
MVLRTDEKPESTCDNPAAQWAEAISLIKETSKVFVATRDTKACLESAASKTTPQQQPVAPAGISPLLKLANELSKVITSNTHCYLDLRKWLRFKISGDIWRNGEQNLHPQLLANSTTSEMAVAESLILLPSTSPAKPQIHPAQQQQPKDSPARSDAASFNRSQTSAGQYLLVLTGEEEEHEDDGDGEGRASTEFAYDDHVVEIVQLDPLPAVIPVVAGSQLQGQEEPAEPLMNKTTSNSAVDVIADSSSRPSSGGGYDDDDFKLLSQPPPPIREPAAVGTIGPSQNDDVTRLSSSSAEEEAAAAESTLPILDANVSSQPLAGTALTTLFRRTVMKLSRIQPSTALGRRLAGNISEELLSPWLPPDVISYRGPVFQSDFLTPTESTTTVAVTATAAAASPTTYAGFDCQCPFADALATHTTDSDAAAVDSITTSVLTNPQSILDPVPLSCPTPPPPPPPACVMTEALTTTTTAMPTTATEATTTPTPTTKTATTTTTTTTKMIPPILILKEISDHNGLTLEIDIEKENFYDLVHRVYTKYGEKHGAFIVRPLKANYT